MHPFFSRQTPREPALSGQIFQNVQIAQANLTRAWQIYDIVAFQLRKGARYRLDREAQIISDVLTGHGQTDGAVTMGFLHPIEQEGGNLLHRAAAAEEKGVILRPDHALHG